MARCVSPDPGDISLSAATPDSRWPVLTCPGPIESSFAIVQRRTPQDSPPDFDHHVVLFPTRYKPAVPAELPNRPDSRLVAGRETGVRQRIIRQVPILEGAGRLGDVVEELDHAIRLALAEGPRGVVCDLSALLEDADPVAVEVLALAGRHVRDWPGIPVAVACPDLRVRQLLGAHPLGRRLLVTESIFSAVSGVLATPSLDIERLQLAPHPTAQRASRDFVARTLRGWRLDRTIPFAGAVVSELVASSSVNAGTAIDLSMAWNLGALRLTVRDHGPALAGPQRSAHLSERSLAVVAGLSHAHGVMPTADGGHLAWAVLEAPARPHLLNSNSIEPKIEPVMLSAR